MFDNYLEDLGVYTRLEDFWSEEFVRLVESFGGTVEAWRIPFYNTLFSNGVKMMDANPIFSAQFQPSGKIIRIVQESHDEMPDVTSWEDEDSGELVIVCSLTDNNLIEVRKVMSSWLARVLLP